MMYILYIDWCLVSSVCSEGLLYDLFMLFYYNELAELLLFRFARHDIFCL